MPHTRKPRWTRFAFLLATVLLLAAAAQAQAPPEEESPLGGLAYGHPDLFILNSYKPIAMEADSIQTKALESPRLLSAEQVRKLKADLSVLKSNTGFFDLRAGLWGTLTQSEPLIPGSGAGNQLDWRALGVQTPADENAVKRAVWDAFTGYLTRFQTQLKIALPELEKSPRISVHEGGKIVQINIQRVFQGVPVRNSYVTATLNSGNLVLFGTRNWGDLSLQTEPSISREMAIETVQDYVRPIQTASSFREPELTIVPFEQGDDLDQVQVGKGIRYRLAWVLYPSFEGDLGTWEALVDAQTGELLSFSDQNQYLTRKVVGGVYPVSNDKELLPAPPVSTGGTNPGAVPGSGTEQPGWPMPFADILLNDTEKTFTNSGGVLSCAEGSIKTNLSGKFVRMNDTCGPISETAASGDLDLGVSVGTDCTVPAGHSAGDTHSSRTGFFEVNRIKEMARSWLPDNQWLKEQLTANMNINAQCNAFWNGASINFYRKSPEPNPRCGNTGEIAAVFDHEWGHGMDANDANPGISFPGEAPADIYAILRLNDSCIGRGFFLREFCSGQGDRCTSCTGVREADWMKRASQKPHDITWILSPVTTPGTPARPSGGCVGAVIGPPPPIPGVTSGPCGQSTHCEGSAVTEVIWDLIHRDLAGAPFNLDVNTRLNLVTRLHYLGGGNVFFWFSCSPPSGGCAADSGYMNYLAVDDDDGNLSNGTPHMTAIFNAFNRHQMACATPTAMNSGCAGTPAKPTVSVTGLDNGARVTWTNTGASKYWVFRADSLDGHACDFGKERVAITTGTEFVDSNLLNGRKYFYTVEAVGANDSCRSSASTCASVIAGGLPIQSAANLSIVPGSAAFTGLTGDGDQFLDNCENARISFTVQNTGNATLTNVRIVNVEPVSHPQVQITSTFPVPVAASLAACTSAPASFTLQAAGLSFNDNVRFRVDLTADEFAPGDVRSEFIEVGDAESDFAAQLTKTFNFDTLNDLEGWELARGTFTQTPPGAPGSAPLHLASRSFQDDACDEIRSPLIRLTVASTLSLQNQFTTEPPLPVFGNVFYDRANVGIFEPATGQRTTVEPSGGRLYNAFGPNGTCVTEGQKGWAGAGVPFMPSSWSAAALQSAAFAGRTVQLDVAYGTDPLVSLDGFQFDQVTLTNFDLQVPDAQSDAGCGPPPFIDARNDSAVTQINTPVQINVVANDETNNPPLTVTAVTDPPHGTATNNGDGTVTYTPDTDFVGTDSFQYTVQDDAGLLDSATVTVHVQRACGEIDDADQAVEYKGGWHRRKDSRATFGGYHRRMGSHGGGNGSTPVAKVVFQGNEITYFYVMSNIGGTADIYIDGMFRETLSYGANQPGSENPTFGHRKTYMATTPSATHEFKIEHRTGAVYVDGFSFACQQNAGADASAAAFTSVTSVGTASASEGPVIERTVNVGANDVEVSVVVEGSLVPLTVRLVDPLGNIVASGQALISGLSASGLDAAVSRTGAYKVQVVNAAGAFQTIEVSIARTVRN